jgi:adenine-specific DNA-methyltransferase
MIKSKYDSYTQVQLVSELKKLSKRKKYGLVWEEEKTKEIFEAEAEGKLPVLVEDKKREIKTDANKPTHIIIEGDNFHALSVLNYTHAKSIDIMYFDPPYNTGAKDWKYNNDYIEKEDSFRHSKWISMMDSRLKLSKKLLKDTGIFICAIDDNEFATLSLLLDEIFPSKTKNVVVIMNNPHGVTRSGFSRCHEYAIFIMNPGQIVNKKPAPPDNRTINLRRSGNNSLRKDSPTMFYPILVNKENFKIIGVGEVPDKIFNPKEQNIDKGKYYEIWPIDSKGIEKNWYYSRKRVEEKGEIELECKMVKDQPHIYFKHSNNSEQTYKSVWIGSEYDAGAYGATMVKKLTNSNFPFPKSINTDYDCLKAVIKSKNAVILDIFAGSGTTGHAVSLLNREDNGNRQFILCTNNENNIAHDVCYPRIKSVIKGHNDYKEITGIQSNLKYYKTNFIGSEPTHRNKKLLTEKSVEMLCIKENTFDEVLSRKDISIFKSEKKYTAILFDEIKLDEFKKEIIKLKMPVSVYVFSLEGDDFKEEFENIKNDITLCSIPEAILKVYRRIYGAGQMKLKVIK